MKTNIITLAHSYQDRVCNWLAIIINISTTTENYIHSPKIQAFGLFDENPYLYLGKANTIQEHNMF